MKKTTVLSPMLAAVCSVIASAQPAEKKHPLGAVDLKPAAMAVYGVRGAFATDPATVRVVLGAATTFAAGRAESWRIESEDDPAYAFSKHVRPSAAAFVDNPFDGSCRPEFALPEGFSAPGPAMRPLIRAVVDLTVPFPLKPDCTYSVIAHGFMHGANQITVTCGRTAAVFSGAPERRTAVFWDGAAAKIVGLRRVSPVGDGHVLLEFGHGFSAAAGGDAANYRISVNGAPVTPVRMGRRSKIDFYWLDGWPYGTLMLHDVYLDLGRELKPGDRVEVSVSAKVSAGERSASFTFDPDKSVTRSIQANQVGYLPDGPKIAYLGCWMGSMPDAAFRNGAADKRAHGPVYNALAPFALRFEEEPQFELVDAKSGVVAHRGKARFVHNGGEPDGKVNHSASNVYELDFSAFARPGRYFISVQGVGRSIAFNISPKVYEFALRTAAQGLYAQRCGCALEPRLVDGWRRDACHAAGVTPTKIRENGRKHGNDFRGNTDGTAVIMASGGHHDAGDYNPRSHIDVAQCLLTAYELSPGSFSDGQFPVPEHGNGIPDVVDEALWAARLWVGLQDPADGGVRNGTESHGDPNFFTTADMDGQGDFAYAKDARGSFSAAGVFAQLSRILGGMPSRKKDAAEYLERAKRAYAWAAARRAEFPENYGDYRAYAAAELFHTTGEQAYHDDFKACAPWSADPNAEIASWGKYDMKLAAYAYALVPDGMADPALRKTVTAAIAKEADALIGGGVNPSKKMAYKFIRHGWAPVNWGTGAYERYAYTVAVAWKLTGRSDLRDWLIRTCDNTLGANPLGLCWITGLGERGIRCPLHNSRYRPAGGPVPGLQAEGPNQNGEGYCYKDTLYPAYRSDFAVMHNFVDTHFAIAMDEGTVDNQAITVAVFGLLSK